MRRSVAADAMRFYVQSANAIAPLLQIGSVTLQIGQCRVAMMREIRFVPLLAPMHSAHWRSTRLISGRRWTVRWPF
jgi:hypothetical protein